MKRVIITLHLIIIALSSQLLNAANGELDVEELRLPNARDAMPAVFEPFDSYLVKFSTELNKLQTYEQIEHHINVYASGLWQQSVNLLKESESWDDRVLYWSRLKLRKALKNTPVFKTLTSTQQTDLLWQLELSSRGHGDSHFSSSADIKILVTGFDPFFLDRNIDQSNPSGVAAMMLDNKEFKVNGKKLVIQAYLIPVRYADFDMGMIESLLKPHVPHVDMIATISMGRSDFDLERFPGRRRSAEAPDNLNIFTGANSKKPLVPGLNGQPLIGPEFVEFSLPAELMQNATGDYKVNDNRNVTTLNGKKAPDSLSELRDDIAVSGAGGGYLSNEISYRSILLRNELRPELPVGHIHTPRIKAFEPDATAKIVKQIEQMLFYAAISIIENH